MSCVAATSSHCRQEHQGPPQDVRAGCDRSASRAPSPARGPYLVRWVALSTMTEMPNAKNRLSEADYRTAAYDLGTFTDRPFNDAGLLDAAKRAERDRTEVGGLDTGS